MTKEKRNFSISHTVLELWSVKIFTTRGRLTMQALFSCS